MAAKKKKAKSSLTPKQKKFCDEYLTDLNATQAAIRAGYSKKNARNIGCENLAKPNIAEYISERLDVQSNKNIATMDEVLEFYTSVMRDENESINVRLRAADSRAKYNGTKTDAERIAIERERLDIEKRKAEAGEPDREIKVVIGGYEESWSE